ncbi:MAG TPA: hypothetical protein PLO57_06935, partial [Candidatus Cloacimonadota bacterium]|nr:hypothetical protein [Candidatus Cloacimonadota bacterium]
KALKEQGVELAISYAGAGLAKRVLPIAEELGVDLVYETDPRPILQQWGALFWPGQPRRRR